VTYFSDLLNQRGAEYVLQQLQNVISTSDNGTKIGRELIKSSNEMVTRLVYQERTVEE
jgi:hypothetical protein